MKLRTLVKFQQCVRTINLVSVFIKFDVRCKHAFTSFFFMFRKYAQQTKNVFAVAYTAALKLQYDVDECYDLVFPHDFEALSHAV